MDQSGPAEFTLPGFRFHPTEEELLDFYLKHAVHGKKLQLDIIATVHLYRHDPWELPGMAKIGEREWYFFVPRDRKQANGGRPSRTTERGFWKATGTDRPVRSAADPKRLIGLKKTLVYYQGRAPRGTKTDWIMNEYRLPDHPNLIPKEDIVLCKIYRKATPMKELEQRAAVEEDATHESQTTGGSPAHSSASCSDDQETLQKPMAVEDYDVLIFEDPKAEAHDHDQDLLPMMNYQGEMPTAQLETIFCTGEAATAETSRPPAMSLPELEVPRYDALDWTSQDALFSQLRSPWMDPCWSPYYATILNF